MYPLLQPSFHLAGFGASVAANQAASALTPFTDGFFSQGVSGLLLPDDYSVVRQFGQGLGLTNYLLNVPSLRQISQPNYGTVNKAAQPVDDSPILVMGLAAPRVLRGEGVNYQVTTDATAGPNQTTVFSWLSKGFKDVTRGLATTIRATATITAVIGSWAAGSLTLAQDLPSGVYEIIGADAYGTGLTAVRFRLPGAGMAPGVLAQQAAGEFFLNNQRFGAMGSFGSFINSQPPTIEITGVSGSIAVTLYIDIVKIA